MDVEFSQFGQNIAQQISEQNSLRPEERKAEESASLESTKSATESVKAIEDLADINQRVNDTNTTIESAVAEVSEFVQAKNRQLDFSIDEKSQRSVVRVTDSESGDVIRQIPSEEVLALSERIKDLQSDVGAAVGVLFNKQA